MFLHQPVTGGYRHPFRLPISWLFTEHSLGFLIRVLPVLDLLHLGIESRFGYPNCRRLRRLDMLVIPRPRDVLDVSIAQPWHRLRHVGIRVSRCPKLKRMRVCTYRMCVRSVIFRILTSSLRQAPHVLLHPFADDGTACRLVGLPQCPILPLLAKLSLDIAQGRLTAPVNVLREWMAL